MTIAGTLKALQQLTRVEPYKQLWTASASRVLSNPFFLYGGCQKLQHVPWFYDQQVRYYAARKGKREKMEKAKKARKLQAVKKEVDVPVRRYAAKAQIPIRARTNMNHPTREPRDDVWLAIHNKRQFHPILEGIEMHRETHHPTVFNLPDALLYLSLELNMNLEKKTRFLDKFSGIAHIPHPFEDGVVKTVLAFCKTEADQNAAWAAGADLVGGVSLIKQIKNGEVIVGDYKYVVSHADMINELGNIKGILKRHVPTANKGSLGVDMNALVMRFKNGLEYNAEKDNVSHDFGWIEVPVGPLSMPSEHLEANIGAVIEAVCKHRSPQLGPFISIALLLCPPSKEKFAIDISKYVPVAPKDTDEDEDDADEIKSVG